jgi:hypothetical protein
VLNHFNEYYSIFSNNCQGPFKEQGILATKNGVLNRVAALRPKEYKLTKNRGFQEACPHLLFAESLIRSARYIPRQLQNKNKRAGAFVSSGY